jgi:lysophospholipase L1-like esterase
MKTLTLFLCLLFSINVFSYPEECRGMESDFKSQLQKFSYRKLKDITIFAGSSSMRMWKNTHNYFDSLYKRNGKQNYFNRGFGGSQICHLLIHYKRLFVGKSIKQHPKRIVIYSGDNDLTNNLSAREVVDHYKLLIEYIRHAGVKSPISIIAVKPSPKRMAMVDTIKKIGELLESEVATLENIQVINIFNRYFDSTGRIRPELYRSDGLHLKPIVYRMWAKQLAW